jgi:cell division protein FtsL
VPAARRRARTQPRLAGSVLWIAAVAVLLTGVVALNVAVLRLNMQLDRLGRERVQLRAENATLSSQLSSAAAAPKIQALARRRLGVVPADPDKVTYLDVSR